MTWSNGKGRGTKYGSQHQTARKQWAAKHQPWHPCARCGHPLGPMGPHLHLDHADDGLGYRGFSHGTACPTCGKKCNIHAGSRKGARIRNAGRPVPRTPLPPTTLRW